MKINKFFKIINNIVTILAILFVIDAFLIYINEKNEISLLLLLTAIICLGLKIAPMSNKLDETEEELKKYKSLYRIAGERANFYMGEYENLQINSNKLIKSDNKNIENLQKIINLQQKTINNLEEIVFSGRKKQLNNISKYKKRRKL